VFVIAAVLTPPDVISQLALAVPTLLLYEASIWLVAAAEKKRIGKEMDAEVKRLESQTTAEIGRKAAQVRAELRRYSAEEAIRLAEEKLKAEINAESDSRLVRSGIGAIGGLK